MVEKHKKAEAKLLLTLRKLTPATLFFQPRPKMLKSCLQRELGRIYCKHLHWTLVKQSEST